jgi:hypothetical protein
MARKGMTWNEKARKGNEMQGKEWNGKERKEK